MTIINPILNDKSEAGDRILWARFASKYLHRKKPQESIVSRGKRYKSGKKYKGERKEKGRIMET